MSRSLTLLFLLVLMSAVTVHSQQSSPSPNEQTADPSYEKAYKLLESLAREIGSLQSAENRARMGSNIADSLWERDENKARELFASVSTELKVVLQSGENKNNQPDDLTEHTFMVFLKLREDTIKRIANHDPELAISFLKETRPIGNRDNAEKERQVELRLATSIASKNPEMALALGRKSLKRGLATDQLDILRQLSRKSPDNATIFYREIVDEIRNKDLGEWGTLQFTQRLVQSFVPRAADESTLRDMGNTLITASLKRGCGQKEPQEENLSFCYLVGNLFHFLERADPQRASLLRRWSANSPPWQPEFSELDEIRADQPLNDLLTLGGRFPQLRDSAFGRAITMDEMLGNFERAREMAKQYPGDPARQQEWLKQIDRAEEQTKVSDERIAEMLREADRYEDIESRINHLINSANSAGRSNVKGSLKLLDKAKEL